MIATDFSCLRCMMDLVGVDESDQVLDLASFSANRKALDLASHSGADEVLDLASVDESSKPLDLATINVTCQDLDLAHVESGHVLDLACTSGTGQVLDLACVNQSRKALDLASNSTADQVLDLAHSSENSHVLDLTCFNGSDQALDLVTVSESNQALDLANPNGTDSHIMELPSLLMATSPVDLTSHQHAKTTSHDLTTPHDLTQSGDHGNLASLQANALPPDRSLLTGSDLGTKAGHLPAAFDHTGVNEVQNEAVHLTSTQNKNIESDTKTQPGSESSSPPAFLQLLYPSTTSELNAAMSSANMVKCRWIDCIETFPTMEMLVNHVNDQHVKVEKDVEYKCHWAHCPRKGKGFNARYKMLIHVRTHTNEKPHQCSLCEKSFSRLENLKIHNRSHTGERPYICPFPGCGKAYSNSSDRFKHVRTHQTERPYVCKVRGCNKKYTDPSSLRKHVKTYGHYIRPETTLNSVTTNNSSDPRSHLSVAMETKDDTKLTLDTSNTIVALTPGLILSPGLQAQLISLQGNVLQLNMLGMVACPVSSSTNFLSQPVVTNSVTTSVATTSTTTTSLAAATQSAATQTDALVACNMNSQSPTPTTSELRTSHVRTADVGEAEASSMETSDSSPGDLSLSTSTSHVSPVPVCLALDSSALQTPQSVGTNVESQSTDHTPMNSPPVTLLEESSPSERLLNGKGSGSRVMVKTREQDLPLDLTTGPILTDSTTPEGLTPCQYSGDGSNHYETVWKLMDD